METWRKARPQDFKEKLPSDRWHGYRFDFYQDDADAGLDLMQFAVLRKQSELEAVKTYLTHLLQSLGVSYSTGWLSEGKIYRAMVSVTSNNEPIMAYSEPHEYEAHALLYAWVELLKTGSF